MAFNAPQNVMDNQFDPLPFMQANAEQKRADFDYGWQGERARQSKLATDKMMAEAQLGNTMAALQEANFNYGQNADMVRGMKALSDSRAAIDAHESTLATIAQNKAALKQNQDLIDIEKKKADASLEEARIKGETTSVQLQMMQEIVNSRIKKKKELLNAQSVLIDEAEHTHKTAAQQAQEQFARNLMGMMNLWGGKIQSSGMPDFSNASADMSAPGEAPQTHADMMESLRDEGIDPKFLFKDSPIYVPPSKKESDPAVFALKEEQRQDRLENNFANRLTKIINSRSGGLGLQDSKVNQAIDLMTMVEEAYDPKTGEYTIPPAYHMELALGLARLLSPTGVPHESTIQALKQATAREGLAGALIYFGVDPKQVGGTTQSVTRLFIDSIKRQGEIAEELRNKYMNDLKKTAPKDLEKERLEGLINNVWGNSFTERFGSSEVVPKESDGDNSSVATDEVSSFLKRFKK